MAISLHSFPNPETKQWLGRRLPFVRSLDDEDWLISFAKINYLTKVAAFNHDLLRKLAKDEQFTGGLEVLEICLKLKQFQTTEEIILWEKLWNHPNGHSANKKEKIQLMTEAIQAENYQGIKWLLDKNIDDDNGYDWNGKQLDFICEGICRLRLTRQTTVPPECLANILEVTQYTDINGG